MVIISAPSLKQDTKLPVILNRAELKELFLAPGLLKQKIVLMLIYSAGLRGQEVIKNSLTLISSEKPFISGNPNTKKTVSFPYLK